MGSRERFQTRIVRGISSPTMAWHVPSSRAYSSPCNPRRVEIARTTQTAATSSARAIRPGSLVRAPTTRRTAPSASRKLTAGGGSWSRLVGRALAHPMRALHVRSRGTDVWRQVSRGDDGRRSHIRGDLLQDAVHAGAPQLTVHVQHQAMAESGHQDRARRPAGRMAGPPAADRLGRAMERDAGTWAGAQRDRRDDRGSRAPVAPGTPPPRRRRARRGSLHDVGSRSPLDHRPHRVQRLRARVVSSRRWPAPGASSG